MQGILFHAILGALASVIAGYMQFKGIGSPDLIAAIGTLAAGNGGAAIQKGAELRRKRQEEKEVMEVTPQKKKPDDAGYDAR